MTKQYFAYAKYLDLIGNPRRARGNGTTWKTRTKCKQSALLMNDHTVH